MIARIPVAIAAALATGSLAIATAGAQESGAPEGGTQTHAAHPRAHAAHGAASTASGTGETAQASYSLGLLVGEQLPRLGLDQKTVNFQKFSQGLKDVMSGKAHPSQADQQKVAMFVQESNATAAKRFLAENAKQPGVKTTQSGLQYKVLSEGSGASPQPSDQVTVNYRGTLLDGTVFDSSYERGQPATFQLNKVIPGWTEALGMMKPGAKWQIFIPPELAYGANPPAPQIPPNALLKFDVELLKVGPPASAPPGASPGGAGPNVGSPTGR